MLWYYYHSIFIWRMEMEDTIAAISTSTVSSGGISIVRISGPDAIIIGDKVFKSKKNIKLANVQSHTVHFGNICDNGNEIDEALVIVMKAPNTYTRENIVEIDCHGGILVTKKVLEAVLNAGARLAEPGEFTKRAFLNGRIDLSQAEAVIDIINAKNDYALKSSVNQLDGKLSEKIKNIREIILNNVAFIEAALDDPEHFDIDANVDNLKNDVENCLNNVDNLLKHAIMAESCMMACVQSFWGKLMQESQACLMYLQEKREQLLLI